MLLYTDFQEQRMVYCLLTMFFLLSNSSDKLILILQTGPTNRTSVKLPDPTRLMTMKWMTYCISILGCYFVRICSANATTVSSAQLKLVGYEHWPPHRSVAMRPWIIPWDVIVWRFLCDVYIIQKKSQKLLCLWKNLFLEASGE